MKVLITTADNGYIVSSWCEEEPENKTRIVVLSDNEHGADDEADLLRVIQETLGFIGSRHDEKRVYVITAPGDKNDKFTEEHANVIWGK